MFTQINSDHPILMSKKDNKDFLPVFGFLKNSNNIEIYTDQPMTSFIVLDNNATCCMIGENLDFFDAFCQRFSGHIAFCGVHDNMLNFLRKKYKFEWQSLCKMYVHNGKPVEYTPDPRIASLKAEHWEMVSNGTPYKPDKEDVIECITNRVSSALYIDGQPVCWCLVHHENSLGMLYTLPEHRRKGYALIVMKDIVNKMLQQGDIPYGFIIEGNDASAALAVKYNMEYHCNASWCGIVFGNN